MNIVRYTYPNRTRSPYSLLDRSPWAGFENEIDRLFNVVLSDVESAPASGRFPVDLFEDAGNAYVRAELPGVNREDINLEVVDGTLTIQATRKLKEGDREESYSVSRAVSLPDTVRAEGVTAAYENGVLTVTLPKREEAKPRKINVSVN